MDKNSCFKTNHTLSFATLANNTRQTTLFCVLQSIQSELDGGKRKMNKLTYLCDMIYEHVINNQCFFVLTSIFHSLAKCHHTYGSQCEILKEFSMPKKIPQDKKSRRSPCITCCRCCCCEISTIFHSVINYIASISSMLYNQNR